MVGVKKKLERRERTRERKALAAAHIEKTIEKELLDRLRSKAYGDAPLNVNEDVWRQVLEMDRKGKEKELDMDEMLDDESDVDEEEEEYEGGEREYVEADDSEDDMEDFSDEVSSICPNKRINLTCQDDEEDSGEEFPSDLEVSDEDEEDDEDEDEDDDGEDAGSGSRPAKSGKAPAPAPQTGSKRKAPAPKKGPTARRRESFIPPQSLGDMLIIRTQSGRRVRAGDRAFVQGDA
jgi:protein MAK16